MIFGEGGVLSQTLQRQFLVSEVGYHAVEIINHYARTWNLLLAYDEDRLTTPAISVKSASNKISVLFQFFLYDYDSFIRVVPKA